MYFFTFHAKPNSESLQFGKLGGAYVNCWIQADNIEQAEEIAIEKIEEQQWKILEKERAFETFREYYTDAKGLEYFEQAVLDEWVLVFNQYPPEDEESQSPLSCEP